MARSRKGNPIVGVIVGAMFTLPALPILYLGEQHTVSRKLSLLEGEKNTVSIKTDTIDPANDKKLVHLQGELKTDAILRDPQFNIKTQKSVHLRRKVEMYQWVESKRTNTSDSGSSTKYSYYERWSTKHHDSKQFYRSGYDNPPMPIRGITWSAKDVTIGAFSLSRKLIDLFDDYRKIPVDETLYNQMPEKEKQKYKFEEGLLLNKGGSQDDPEIGDIRITFQEAKPARVTILSMQSGNSFKPYPTGQGEMKVEETLALGDVSVGDLFKAKSLTNLQDAWVLRGFTFIFATVGALVLMAALNQISKRRKFLFLLAGGKWLPRTALGISALLSLIMTIHWLGHGITGTISLIIAVMTGGGWLKYQLDHASRRSAHNDDYDNDEGTWKPAEEMPIAQEDSEDYVVKEK